MSAQPRWVERGGTWAAVSWPAALPKPSLSGSTATYANAGTGVCQSGGGSSRTGCGRPAGYFGNGMAASQTQGSEGISARVYNASLGRFLQTDPCRVATQTRTTTGGIQGRIL